MPSLPFVYNGRWKLRFVIFLVLIGPLYILPSALRALLVGHAAWPVGLLASDVFGCLVTGFLTNSYRFAAVLYVSATAFEALLLLAGHEPALAVWIGDLAPALVAIYFAQQLYINMGD